jgi:hypothetical protein
MTYSHHNRRQLPYPTRHVTPMEMAPVCAGRILFSVDATAALCPHHRGRNGTPRCHRGSTSLAPRSSHDGSPDVGGTVADHTYRQSSNSSGVCGSPVCRIAQDALPSYLPEAGSHAHRPFLPVGIQTHPDHEQPSGNLKQVTRYVYDPIAIA